MNRRASCVLLILAMAACGGDDDGKVPDEILPAARYAAKCESPRKGVDADGDAFIDKKGSLLDEQLWLRSWIDDTYLWYKEVPAADPKMFDTALDYFGVLKTFAKTASNKAKDQFHFTYTTEEWLRLSESGVEASYGLTWTLIKSSPPRQVVVAYVEPGSPADMAGIVRGATAVKVDGVAVIDSNDIDTLNDGLFPPEANKSHTLEILDPGASAPRTVMITSADLTSTPVRTVPLTGANAHVGYIIFNDHIATAEKGLYDAITALKAQNVDELVLDLRYNGGGYLDIASELAYMIAGPTSAGMTFDKIEFNDKHTATDPVTGESLAPTTFHTQSLGFKADLLPRGQALPTLNLTKHRVFVLTGPGTCSASEAVINGLAGAGVEVIQIGNTTCGKPYGFYPTDNCGTTYFAIQFQGVNAKGFGDYADGFVPGTVNKGCAVDDDFTHQLGDPAEGRLAKALAYMADPAACGAASFAAGPPLSAVEGVTPKPLWRQNAILRAPKP